MKNFIVVAIFLMSIFAYGAPPLMHSAPHHSAPPVRTISPKPHPAPVPFHPHTGPKILPRPIVPPKPVIVVPLIYRPPVPPPAPIIRVPYVLPPYSTTQQVWIDGHYEDQIGANGLVIKIWVPGCYVTITN